MEIGLIAFFLVAQAETRQGIAGKVALLADKASLRRRFIDDVNNERDGHNNVEPAENYADPVPAFLFSEDGFDGALGHMKTSPKSRHLVKLSRSDAARFESFQKTASAAKI
jgi:hypothetical protein